MAIAPSRPVVSRLFLRTLMGTTVLIGVAAAQQAAAQTRAVSVCTGVQLQPSVVTDIVAPVLIGITAPIEGTVNQLLDIPLLNLLGVNLDTNVTGLLQTARAGQPITLQALATDGNVIGPGDPCRATSDSISLNTPAGISIGGNRISGLGAEGAFSSAADVNAIAFGNGAIAGTGATGSIAFGFNSNVSVANSVALGAGSVAERGARANYAALGLAAPQSSVGEVSVGTAAGARQITNVAAGIEANDAATVGQLTGVAAQVSALAGTAVQYDDATRARATLGGAGGTVLANVGAGALTATSAEAVNGSQLFATNTQVAANTGDIAALQGATANAVRYDVDAAGVRTGGVTLAGATPGATVTLSNVGTGAVTATSTDAVNGAQLFATNTQVGTNTTAIAGLDTRVTGNTNAIGALDTRTTDNTTAIGGLDTRTTNNTTAIAGLDTRVTTNTTDIAALQGAVAGAVRYDVDAAGNRTGGVTFVGATPGASVTLGNVGAGALTATSTDAVNGSQLFATNTQVGTNTTAIAGLDTRVATNTTDIAALQGSAVRYDVDAAGVRTGGLTLAGATPGAAVTLGNVAAGALTATSTDAVNGAQLFATNTQVGTNTTAIAGLDTRVTGNTTAIGALDTRTTDNSNAIAGLDTRTTNNTTAIAGLDTRVTTNTTDIAALQGLSANAVRYDVDAAGNRTGGVTLVGATPGATVTLGNVGAGALTATSTDAVNGSQLFATNTQVGTNTTAIAGLDTRVTTNTQDIAALQGTTANAVRYDVDAAGNRTGVVTFLGATPGATATLANVGAGALTATSTDAVNGSQLFATNTQVGTNTTAIAGLDTRTTNNTNAIAGLDTRVTTNTQDIATLQGTTANAVRYDVDAAGNRTGGITLVGAAPGQAVTIGNVAGGALTATSTDAVNGSQLFATNQRLDGAITSIGGLDTRVNANATALAALAASAAQYDNVARDRLTFGGAAGTVLANVAAGQLSATSNEAVNGSQLFATNTRVAANTAAIAQIGNGSAGPVRYANPATPTTPNGGTVTDDLTLVGASGGAVALHNVRAGTVGAGSTDAVNGDQLNTTNQAVAALDTRVTATEGRLTTVETNVAGLDTRISNNTTQIANNTTAINNLQTNVAGTSTAVTNLTTRVDNNTTAITNLQTQVGNAPIKYADAGSPTTPNGGTITDDTTLVGASGGPVGLHNVRAGVVATGSTDAINGGQLAATNAQVTANTTAITNLSNTIGGSTVAAIQYSNPGSPTTPNGGVRTNDVTLVGVDAAAPVGLHNVASGSVAAGSTDAVNGGQLFAVAQQSSNSLQYDRNAAGQRSNTVTLAGGNAAAPVTLANVANGTVAAGSTQAVNGGQLYTTNQTAQAALALGSNSVQYAADGGVSLGNGTTPVAVRNVAAGTAATDAVNVGQLQASMRNTFVEATNYVDSRLTQVGFDLRDMRRDMSAGSSAAMAVAALPQAMEPGATMVAIGAGTYRGQSAMAFGASRAFADGQAVVKFGGTIDSRGYAGANAGVGFQF